VDVARAEMVESELDAMIRRRHDKRASEEGHRPSEEMWAQSVRRYNAQQRQRHRAEWCEHFERMRALHSGLADEYDAKLRRMEQTA
jgi:hypothetical protein